MTMTTAYLPHTEIDIRAGAAALLAGRRRTDEVELCLAAAILLDGALAGVFTVTGRFVLGFDRRRVVPSGVPDPAWAPTIADLHRRIVAATEETPWGWCQRAAVFADARTRDELAGRPLSADRARNVVLATLDGGGTRTGYALTRCLHETELLGEVVGGRRARDAERSIRRSGVVLPHAAGAVLITLAKRRRRGERIGSWYDGDG